jgi:hypothetical protein
MYTLVLALVGCSPAPEVFDGTTGSVLVRPDDTYGTVDSGISTVVTTDPTVLIDCTALPEIASVDELFLTTEEDFDFDHRGFLIYQGGNDLVGRKYDGTLAVISAGVSVDAAGMQTLSDGNIVVASPDTGDLEHVNRSTGANHVLVGGLSSPNGLEVGPGDTVYFTEYFGGRVRWTDPATGDGGEISDSIALPNGLAFSPDAQRLYVTANGAGSEGIVMFSREDDGFDDGAPFMIGAPGNFFDSVETDICGNVYTVEFSSGTVFRLTPDGLTREVIADLNAIGGNGSYASIKWGSGIGQWETDKLYVTNRQHIFVLDVGIQGTPDALPPF